MWVSNSPQLLRWVGGASVTWHVFQSALSPRARRGLGRRPRAPTRPTPSLTPPSTPSTSWLCPCIELLAHCLFVFGSILGLGFSGGHQSTDSQHRRPAPQTTCSCHHTTAQRNVFVIFADVFEHFPLKIAFLVCSIKDLFIYISTFLRPVVAGSVRAGTQG